MRSRYDQFTNFKAPKGLYCVWARNDNHEGSSLVARWIDPRTEENNRKTRAHLRFDLDTEEIQLEPDLVFA